MLALSGERQNMISNYPHLPLRDFLSLGERIEVRATLYDEDLRFGGHS